MKAYITDKKILQNITVSELTTYLLSKGANKVSDFADKATIWQYDNEELFLPLSTHFADYTLRVAEALGQFEQVEGRSQLAILDDIKHITYDVIRVRNVSSDSKDGTLGFSKSVDFITYTREMLLAAACSAATQKIHYPGRKPQNAEDFMKSVRFGKTEQGSFVLTLLSPVSPDLNIQRTLFTDDDAHLDEQPYEKKVIPTLESGLNALNLAAQHATIDKELRHFTEAAPQGVSTNLCDAISNMYEHLTPDYIEVNITYSGNRKIKRPIAKVTIDNSYIPIIREASKDIKNTEPELEQTIRGNIIKLASPEPKESGEIILQDITSARPRNINIHLSGEDYSRAAEAHVNKWPVEFNGNIIKTGRTLRLEPFGSLEVFPFDNIDDAQ